MKEIEIRGQIYRIHCLIGKIQNELKWHKFITIEIKSQDKMGKPYFYAQAIYYADKTFPYYLWVNEKTLAMDDKNLTELLKHEVAHFITGEGHTKKFREFCQKYNIDYKSKGVMGGIKLR